MTFEARRFFITWLKLCTLLQTPCRAAHAQTSTFTQVILAFWSIRDMDKMPTYHFSLLHTRSYNHCATPVQLRSILTSMAGFLPKQSTHRHSCVMRWIYMQLYYAHREENALIITALIDQPAFKPCFSCIYLLVDVLNPVSSFGIWGGLNLNGGQTSTTFRAFFLSSSPQTVNTGEFPLTVQGPDMGICPLYAESYIVSLAFRNEGY